MAKKVGNTYFFTGKGKSSGGGGGGGDATDAIKYTEQTLNESQQMQARKNQGLYYSEGGGEDVTINWDGDTTGLESVDIGDGVVLYKVSDDAPQKESVKSIGMTVSGDEQIIDIPQQSIIPIEGGYGIGDAYVIVATESEASLDSYTFTKGIWFVKGTTGNYTSKFTYGATETIHHIEPKYIKDMYYEEEGVKTINYDINGSRVGSYTKVSDEIIEASAVIGHKFTSYSSDNGNTKYTITEDMVIAADSTHPTRILFDSSDPNSWAILIFPEDMVFEEDSFSKGVWFGDGGTIVHPNHIESLEYEGVTVHQIPAKYIPQTVPAVKIEIPSNESVSYGIGYVLLNNNVTDRDVVFSIEGKTINQVSVRNMLDTTSTGDVWSFGTGNTYNFDTSGYYLVEIEVRVTGGYEYYYATVFVETANQ